MAPLKNHSYLKILTILSVSVGLQWSSVTALPDSVLPPPQVLLPPHREEGQPLDDIFLGGSSAGTVTASRTSFSKSLNRGQTSSGSFKVVQTFIPPTNSPPSLFPSSSSKLSSGSGRSSSSAEEIKVPQPLKLRTERRQYSKADLIAAANLLKPAGFDFSKVLLLSPSFFNQSRSKLFQTTAESENDLLPLYEHVMFPLPLLDTPVFNELKPFMEMLMREVGSKLGKSGVAGDSGIDNKKVLVIIPKAMLRSGSTQPRKASPPTRKPQIQPQFRNSHHMFQKLSQSKSTGNSTTSPKFIIVPKGSKLTTTSKPKYAPSSAVTTKRPSKVGTLLPSKKQVKGSDLQVAATSNKLTQRPGGNPHSIAPKGSPVEDKRSYSASKGGEKYSFSYSVKNDEFGDVKSHSESRDGDQVAGEYSMLEADGYTRVVRYTVDSDQGFKASVKRIPPS